jgi:hypothetical protein
MPDAIDTGELGIAEAVTTPAIVNLALGSFVVAVIVVVRGPRRKGLSSRALYTIVSARNAGLSVPADSVRLASDASVESGSL